MLKWRKIMQTNYTCERCGTRYKGKRPRQAVRAFQLHHRHYRSVGGESFEDVQVLCRPCHASVHGKSA